KPLKLARSFHRQYIVRLLNDADDGLIAMRIAAEIADLAIADVIADGANAELILDVEDRLRQPFGIFAAGAQHVERNALRRFLPDARQFLEFLDQQSKRLGKIGHVLEHSGREAKPPEHPAHLLL